MKARSILLLACAAVVLPAAVFAQKPPVKVEIIVEGDDEDEDFFREEKSDKEGVRKRADGVFDELETEDGVKVRTIRKRSKSGADNDNSATQVVNVIVSGSNQKQKTEPKTDSKAENKTTIPAVPAAPAAPVAPAPAAPVAASGPATTQAPPAPDCNCEQPIKVKRRRKRRRRGRYWRVPSHVQRGDVMLAPTGGWGTAGGLIGLKLEGMASRSVGIQFRFQLTGFDSYDIREEGRDLNNFLTNEEWGVPQLDLGNVRRGFAHVTDLALAWHWFRKSRFDFHPTIGVSHFGYDVDLREGPSVQGGSAFLRLGLGLNWHWRRVFFGVDVGWYPYELIRYELRPDDDGDGRSAETVEVDDRYNSKRVISSAHVGFRF